MRFLVDAQLPPALARWLSGQGYVAEHVLDLAMATSSDRDIWAYAMACGATIITKDQDFAGRRARLLVLPSSGFAAGTPVVRPCSPGSSSSSPRSVPRRNVAKPWSKLDRPDQIMN